MPPKSDTGKLGEQIACDYLVRSRYRIVDRNYWKPWGEIDVIARARDGMLVFVEVKTMYEHPSLKPEDHLTRAKLEKLSRTASLYAGAYPDRIRKRKGWRIDLIAITLNNDLTNKSNNENVKHYENIAGSFA